MIKKISIYTQTVKNLKAKQIFYRLYYAVYKKNKTKYIRSIVQESFPLKLQSGIFSFKSYWDDNTFSFLNQTYSFQKSINWNYTGYGMLWAYNLNYFEFLLQAGLSMDTGLKLIRNFIRQKDSIRIGFDSYPISLRNIFWIRFLSKYSIEDKQIDAFLFDEYEILKKHLEFHLLGNHLLENAFSLLFGAYYFHNEKMYRKAYKLLKEELNEQILNDGAHFELSPMYHQILLYRLLDCINLVQNNNWKDDDLLKSLSAKASSMLAWLDNMTFSSGKIPLMNDASENIAPASKALFEYAERLNIEFAETALSDSNYRIFKDKNYKCIMDIGGIVPAYQPGHAHADTFNFVLEVNNSPVIVDTGCSTYEQGNIRLSERGTSTHNTVTINGLNSSQVWAGHRIGKRAEVFIEEDKADKITAQHNGYRMLGKIHSRTFVHNKHSIQITDEINKSGKPSRNIARFHLHHTIKEVDIKGNTIQLPGSTLLFEGFLDIRIENCEQALSFNDRIWSKCICVTFDTFLKTTFIL